MRGTPVELGSRGFDLLISLIKREGQLATKGELMAEVWPGIVVGENNLPAQITGLRKVLAGDAGCERYLQTVPGRGYRFVARVEHEGAIRVATDITARQDEFSARLSLVVLPFSNLSSDPDQIYFARGMTETVTTDLSRISGLLVIASTTAAVFKDELVDLRQVCRELNARFCVRGSVQRNHQKVRINAQLVDGASGIQMWSERFDGNSSNLFALQDQITGRIANSIGRKINRVAAREAERRVDLNAMDLLMRGIAIADLPQFPRQFATAGTSLWSGGPSRSRQLRGPCSSRASNPPAVDPGARFDARANQGRQVETRGASSRNSSSARPKQRSCSSRKRPSSYGA